MNLTAYYLDVSDTLLADLFYALKITNQNLFTTTYQRIIKSLPSNYDLKGENLSLIHILFIFRNIFFI